MKHKLLIFSLVLAMHMVVSIAQAQYSKIMHYHPASYTIGDNQSEGRSLILLPNNNYLFLGSHFEISADPKQRRAEFQILDEDLEIIENYAIELDSGGYLHDAIQLQDNIYAIVGSVMSGLFQENSFVFLIDFDNLSISTQVNLVYLPPSFSLYRPLEINAGLAEIEVASKKCITVLTNSMTMGHLSCGTCPAEHASSVLSILEVDIPNMTLTYKKSWDLYGATESTDWYIAKDIVSESKSSNIVYTISEQQVLNNIQSSFLSKSVITFNGSDYNIANSYRRIHTLTNTQQFSLNKIEIANSEMIFLGTHSETSTVIAKASLSQLFPSTSFSNMSINANSIGVSSGRCRFPNFNFNPNSSSIITVSGMSNAINPNTQKYYPYLYQFKLDDNSIVPLLGDHNFNAIRFTHYLSDTAVDQNHITDLWSPMSYNAIHNKVSVVASFLNPRIFSYEYNSNGFTAVGEDVLCAKNFNLINSSVELKVSDYITTSPEVANLRIPETNSLYKPTRYTHNACESKSPCPQLTVIYEDCYSIEIGLPGNAPFYYLSQNGNFVQGPVEIYIPGCHTIIYMLDTLGSDTCEASFDICLKATAGCSKREEKKSTNKTEMTRWVLDNMVTEFSTATQQMKDGKAHTLCYEKFNQKTENFEQISCEEVKPTSSSNPNADFDFNAFPSPASAEITLQINNYVNETLYKAVLFNSIGSNVKEYVIKSSSSQLSLEGVNSGSYTLTLYQSNKKISSKTIIVRK